MARIIIGTEREVEHGWEYEVRVEEGARSWSFQVRLNWAEHDLWSHGRVAPQHVVRAAFKFLLSREPVEAILPRFDCAVIRRYFPEVDRELPKLIDPNAKS